MSKDTKPRKAKGRGPGRGTMDQWEARLHDPWGTISIDFAFGSRGYPVDHNNRNFVVAFLSQEGALTGMEGWLDFDTLDDRCVRLNLALVRKLRFVGPEVDYPIRPIRWFGARKPHEARALSNVRITDADGATCEFPLNDATGGHLAMLDNHLHEVGANALLPMREEGGTLQVLNLNSVAAIEVPLESYYERYHSPEIVTPSS